MNDKIQISEAELEVMKILWKIPGATSAQVIEQLTPTTSWKSKTIQTMLARLVTKGAVSTEPITAKIFRYQPMINEDDYKNQENAHFLDKLYQGSLNVMVTHFVQKNKLTKKEIEELRQILDEEETP